MFSNILNKSQDKLKLFVGFKPVNTAMNNYEYIFVHPDSLRELVNKLKCNESRASRRKGKLSRLKKEAAKECKEDRTYALGQFSTPGQAIPCCEVLALKDHWTSKHANAYLARRRLQLGETRLAYYKQKISECEETIWKIQNDMAELDQCRQTLSSRKTEADKLYRALERKRMEEEERMVMLQNAAAKTLKEIENDSEKFETALGQSVDNNNE